MPRMLHSEEHAHGTGHCAGAAGNGGRISMDCLKCTNLEQAFEFTLSKYVEARFAPFFRVSSELAARKMVDMERAKNDIEEHQLRCAAHPQH